MRLILIFCLFCLFISNAKAQTTLFKRDSAKFGNVFKTNPLPAYGQIPNSAPFKLGKSITVEAQVRFNNPFNPTGAAIFVNSHGNSSFSEWGFGLVALDHRVGFHVCTSTPQQIMANSTDTLSACQWYHIAGVMKGDSMLFYINGVLKATNLFPSNQNIREANGAARIGAHRPGVFQNYFNGEIDELRIYNFPKTKAQIIAEMNDTLQGNEAGLVAYYKFNESFTGSNNAFSNSSITNGSAINGLSVGSASLPVCGPQSPFPIPQPPTVISPINLCGWNGNTPININTPSPATNIRFRYLDADTNLLSSTGSASFPVNVSAPGTYNFYTQVFNRTTRCLSPLTPVTIVNAPKPPVPLLRTDTICQNGPIVLRASSAGTGNFTYQWFRLNPTTALGQSNTNTFAVANAAPGQRYAVFYAFAGSDCVSDTAYVTVQQGGFRPVNASVAPETLCANNPATISFSGLSSGQTVFIFADSLRQNLISTTLGNSSYSTPPLGASMRFYFSFQPDSNGCQVLPFSLPVTVFPKPVAPMLTIDTICGTATTTLRAFNALSPVGMLYNWYSGTPPAFINQGLADTLLVVAQPGQSFSVSLTHPTTGCISDTISTLPPVGFKSLDVAIAPSSVCPGGISTIFFNDLTTGQTAFIYSDTLRQVAIDSITSRGQFNTPPMFANTRFYFTFEADSAGCRTRPFSLPVTVSEKPVTTWSANNPSLICNDIGKEKKYAVIGAVNSTFKWVLPQQDTVVLMGPVDASVIAVKWLQKIDSAVVKVQEVGVNNCLSDTLSLIVFFEHSKPLINRVTTALIDDQNVEVFYNLLDVNTKFMPSVVLYRDNDFLREVPVSDGFYTDSALNTAEQMYKYHVELVNVCGDTLSSDTLTNTVLTKKREGNLFQLSWEGPQKLNFQPFERTLNDSPKFSAAFTELERIQSVTNVVIWNFDEQLVEPCFRMRFRTFSGTIAQDVLSNRVCDLVLPDMVLPNLITANGDGVNDTFEVKLIRFYQPIIIEVFNRWGIKVYENKAYNNDWDASALPAGMYYYRLNLSANPVKQAKQYTGWVQIVK